MDGKRCHSNMKHFKLSCFNWIFPEAVPAAPSMLLLCCSYSELLLPLQRASAAWWRQCPESVVQLAFGPLQLWVLLQPLSLCLMLSDVSFELLLFLFNLAVAILAFPTPQPISIQLTQHKWVSGEKAFLQASIYKNTLHKGLTVWRMGVESSDKAFSPSPSFLHTCWLTSCQSEVCLTLKKTKTTGIDFIFDSRGIRLIFARGQHAA